MGMPTDPSSCSTFGSESAPSGRPERFRHEALFYAGGNEGFLKGTLPLVERALEGRSAVLVAVGPARRAALREALGADAGGVEIVDMQRVGRNPAQIISVWKDFLRRHPAGGALGIGEPVWPERSPAELSECILHEGLLNVAFDGGPAWHLLCPYDLDGLDDPVIEAALGTHPVLSRDGESESSAAYRGAHQPRDPFAGTLPPAPGIARELSFTARELAKLRRLVSAWAGQSLGRESSEELVLAVNELTTNSVRHGGGRGTLRLWREGETLLCEVQDAGRIDAPLVGRIRPTPDAYSGRGVWMANQLCDLVQIRSAATGTVVRVHKSLL
jgi:anti-sigma regulatory factor (Ser/Thr protein kinase)